MGGGGSLDTKGMGEGFQQLGSALYAAREQRRQRELQGADLNLAATADAPEDDQARISAVQQADEVRRRWIPGWTGFPTKTVGGKPSTTTKSTPTVAGGTQMTPGESVGSRGTSEGAQPIPGTPDVTVPGTPGKTIPYAPGSRAEMTVNQWLDLNEIPKDNEKAQAIRDRMGSMPISAMDAATRGYVTSRLRGDVDPQTASTLEHLVDEKLNGRGPEERKAILARLPADIQTMFPGLNPAVVARYAQYATTRSDAIDRDTTARVDKEQGRQSYMIDKSEVLRAQAAVGALAGQAVRGELSGADYDSVASHYKQVRAAFLEKHPEEASMFPEYAVGPAIGGTPYSAGATRAQQRYDERIKTDQLRDERLTALLAHGSGGATGVDKIVGGLSDAGLESAYRGLQSRQANAAYYDKHTGLHQRASDDAILREYQRRHPGGAPTPAEPPTAAPTAPAPKSDLPDPATFKGDEYMPVIGGPVYKKAGGQWTLDGKPVQPASQPKPGEGQPAPAKPAQTHAILPTTSTEGQYMRGSDGTVVIWHGGAWHVNSPAGPVYKQP